jgi:hypothetical protein
MPDRAVSRGPASFVARDAGSFRDPTGFVYRRDGVIYRQINAGHAADWGLFRSTGLYDRLTAKGWLVEQTEVDLSFAFDDRAAKVLRPREIDFVSYPYEWTFSQLKDAALLTLDIQEAAVASSMSLKDASAYNVTFDGPRPVLIDALSFEARPTDMPWVAYRQFCQHFLAPLALMAKRDIRSGALLRDFIDGIPLDLAARLLPTRSRLQPGLAMHLHLHARAQKGVMEADDKRAERGKSEVRMSRERLEALIDSLRRTIKGLEWDPHKTQWAAYGETSSYTDAGAASKARLVEQFVAATDGNVVWDLGAANGAFSRIAAGLGRTVVAIDGDQGSAEQVYRDLKKSGETGIMPLVVDLSNPSPALGWAHRERRSLADRANADTLVALAVIHHLAIGNNVPLRDVSSYFAQLGRQLVIEFVPKEDPRVKAMLIDRKDVFADYTLDGMLAAFATEWELVDRAPIEDSPRTLLRFNRR